MPPHTSSAPWLDRCSSYYIRVRGVLDVTWSERLGGLTLSVARQADGAAMTTLSGELADQSALLGVLNTLHDLGLPLESMERTAVAPPEQAPTANSLQRKNNL